ncbi:MAG: hypothetical protein C0444_07530 [Microbacterium sp.]|nr:hypothetical protein [Microbacterium sp.]
MDEIVKANVRRYESSVVTNYSKEPLHAIRFGIVAEYVDSEIAHRSGIVSIAELAPGGVYIVDRLAAGSERYEYVGIDAAKVDSGKRIMQADLTKTWPLEDNAVDVLVALEIIEHVFDTSRFLSEIRRVLRPGGMVVISTPNLASLQDRIGFLAGRAPRQTSPLHEYLKLHIRPFTLGSLRESLGAFGLKVEAQRSNAIIWRSRKRAILLWKRPPRFLTGIGNALIVSARLSSVGPA